VKTIAAGIEAVWHDLRYGGRSLRKNPGFALVAILTLALGIGANTAIFSVVNGVLLDPLPYAEPDRLTFIWAALDEVGYRRAPLSGPELNDLRERSRLFQDFGSIWSTTGALVEGDEPESLRLGLVTANFLPLLGTPPARGRLFLPEDEGAGAPKRIILSDRLWRGRFGADDGALGRDIRVDGGWGFPGGTYTVVGVMPPGFRLILPPDAGIPAVVDAFVPFANDLARGNRGVGFLRTVGRMNRDTTLAAANAEIAAIGQAIKEEFTEYAATGKALSAESLHGEAVRPIRPVVLALLGGVSFILLIACANVANLLLARAAGRRKEISIRIALGASRWRIAVQLLTESLLLSAIGGAAGLFLAAWGLDLLLALRPGSLPQPDAVGISMPVLGFAMAISILSGLLFGLAPMVESCRVDLNDSLKAGGRRGTGTPRHRTRNLLVIGEIALGVILLIGAGLMLKTFLGLQRVDPGFDSTRVVTFQLSLPAARYPTAKEMANFSRNLERDLAALPAVEAAGAINQLPLDDLPNWSTSYRRDADDDAAQQSQEADARVVTPGYFRAIRARLVEGRLFEASDDEDARKVIIVDESLARRTWPGDSALGKRLQIELWGGRGFVSTWTEVVGVVAHVRHHTLAEQVRPQVFAPFAQGPRNQMGIAVRAGVDPALLTGPIRDAVAALDKDLAPAEFLPMARYVSDSTGGERFTMILAGVFAAVALLLASIGLYGVIACSVSQRTWEIGIRMALGAQRGSILRMVLGQGLGLILIGVAAGIAGAFVLTRFLETLLYGVTPTDAATFAAIPLLLTVVALLACYLPARRAMRVDPMMALRQE
jgi:putative ABC transport system permease protein